MENRHREAGRVCSHQKENKGAGSEGTEKHKEKGKKWKQSFVWGEEERLQRGKESGKKIVRIYNIQTRIPYNEYDQYG